MIKLSTERLHLSTLCLDDADELHKAVIESLGALRRFPASLPWAQEEQTAQTSREFCELACKSAEQQREFAFFIRTLSAEPVGVIALHRIDWKAKRFEIGFWARTSKTGQGFMAEAARGVSEWAESRWDAQVIFALPDVENQRSLAVLESSSFKRVSLITAERLDPEGNPRDSYLYERRRLLGLVGL